MKKLFTILLALMIAATTIVPVMAWRVDVVDWSSVEVEYEEYNEPSDWAMEEIANADEYGILPAFTDNPKFQDAITREQFAELIVCMLEARLGGEIEPAGSAFSDCDNTQVLKAYAVGVVNGIGEDLFDPKTTTNREQIATMLCRALNFLEGRLGRDFTPADADISTFVDSAEVSDWAQEGVGVLAANGLMKGTSTTTLSPQEPCTVEQSIALATRIFELVSNN